MAGNGSFANKRARLQRLKDAKFFSGWVLEAGKVELRLRIPASVELEPGETFSIEISGPEAIVTFQAQLTSRQGSDALLAVTSMMRFGKGDDNARSSVSGVTGTAEFEGLMYPVTVLDISAGGVGLRLSQPISPKSFVALKLTGPTGVVCCRGEIRYCRPDPEAPGLFRAGVRCEELGRLEKARWSQLVISVQT